MTGLFTIGYEGAAPPEFLRSLAAAGVNVLVDIRDLPLSRRKGFSKSALAALLERHGIAYVHCKALGAPKNIRNRLRQSGDYETYFRQFRAHLAKQCDALEHIALLCAGAVALMCYERDPKECHRSVVARELGRMTGLAPIHLIVGAHGPVREAPRLRAREGATAA